MGRGRSDTDFWRRVREALEREGAEREAFLDEFCAGRAELRAEVDRLLALERSLRPDLDPPTPTSFRGLLPGAPASPPHRIGPYAIVRDRARAGQRRAGHGVARGAHRRRVYARGRDQGARPGPATAAVLARFQRQRQLLAGLDHPGIARMYEGGETDDGLPYLVMEFVDGAPIDRWADEHRFTTRERVALFRRVCAAVHGAHQRLIVHRDLEPGNVLVGSDGEPSCWTSASPRCWISRTARRAG